MLHGECAFGTPGSALSTCIVNVPVHLTRSLPLAPSPGKLHAMSERQLTSDPAVASTQSFAWRIENSTA